MNILQKSTFNFLRFLLQRSKLKVDMINVPEEFNNGSVLVFNHLTHIETFVLPVFIKGSHDKISYSLMHHSFFFNRVVALINQHLFYCISTADKLKYNRMCDALKEGHNVIIYPQGCICKNNPTLKSHRGAALVAVLAKESNPDIDLNIIPCRIEYSHDCDDPNWLSRLLRLNRELTIESNMLLKHTTMTLIFGKPIEVHLEWESREQYLLSLKDRYHAHIVGKRYNDIAEWQSDNHMSTKEIERLSKLKEQWIADNPHRSHEVQPDYRG